jgi:alcohol dehydrogenase class IV
MTVPDAFIHTGYAQRLHFGAGALNRVAEVVRETGARRVMLVTSAGRHASDDGQRLVRLLGRSVVATFADVHPHVPTTDVQAAVADARSASIDCVVSFGGGSCADLGKAVCYFLEQESGVPGASYVDRPAVAHVAVPTTYAGAELTPSFGMTDEATRTKAGAGGPTIAPIAAVYDPEVTVGTPPRTSAETGMNAVAHGVEVAWSPTRSAEAEALALACIAAAVDALPRVVDDPSDLPARTDMLRAAMLGGRALQNGTTGVHHGLAQLLGGRTGMPHGLANAVILPHAMRFNADVIPVEMHRIGLALGDPEDAAGAAARLVERLGLPTSLRACGVTDEDVDVVARMAEGNRSVGANPRPVGVEDARAILAAAL